jgi:glycosyltransferase involved in cell wall biosynthesis
VNLSIITTCMDRLEFIVQTIPTWLNRGADEVIVVDWSSKEPLTPASVLQDRVIFERTMIVRVEGQQYFNAGLARNTGAHKASGEFLLFIDSDMLLNAGLAAMCKPEFSCTHRHGIERKPPYGTCLVSSSLFWRIGGYSEDMPSYGYEDNDLYHRLDCAGGRSVYFPPGMLQHIDHPDQLRTEKRKQEGKGIYQTVEENKRKLGVWNAESVHAMVPTSTVIV